MKLILTSCLLLFYTYNFSQTKSNQFSIANWQDNKKAALSLTFDDCINGQFTVALPLLNQHNFKATFFLTIKNVSKQLGGWQLIQQAAKDGHEIANHTTNHFMMHTISVDSMNEEFSTSDKEIKANVPSAKDETMAYPFGDGGNLTDSDLIVRRVAYKYFIGARSVQYQNTCYNAFDFAKTNDNYCRINSEMIADSATIASFADHLDSTIQAGTWYVPTYHGIENGWIIVPKNQFAKHLDDIESRKENLWIAPFANVLKYVKERNCTSIKVIQNNKLSTIITLTDTLNNQIWNEPLTVNYTTSEKIKSVTQNNQSIPFIHEDGAIIFDVIPSSKKITLIKQ